MSTKKRGSARNQSTGEGQRLGVAEERGELSPAVSSSPLRRVCQGPVMPIGGGEEREIESAVLSRFVALAGGKEANILVVPTASNYMEEVSGQYIDLFTKMGAGQSTALMLHQRPDANADPAVQQVNAATAIFVTGGAQSRLVELLVGTRAGDAIRMRNAEGVIFAGTSAGASLASSHMILGGTSLAGHSSSAAARRGLVEMVAGLGLLQDVIIDQHFSERGRMGRLLSIFAGNPGLLAIGLDEDTGVLVTGDGIMETIGSGMVTLIDGREATSDNFRRTVGEVLTVVGSHLHVLGPGQRFDLDARTYIPPAA